MRGQFEYYGLKTPTRQVLFSEHFKTYGYPEGQDLKEVIDFCFDDPHREMQYLALEIIKRRLKRQDADFIYILEELVQRKSWWDTVDWLFMQIGHHFKRFPHFVPALPDKWIDDDDFWLNRVAILFQLKYKDQTDEGLLFSYILKKKESKEFFIQKAAGWALREYSKTAPEIVVNFIESQDLAALTKREGLKWLKSKGRL